MDTSTVERQDTKSQHHRVLAFVVFIGSIYVLSHSIYTEYFREGYSITPETFFENIPSNQEIYTEPPLVASSSLPVHIALPTVAIEADFEEPLGIDKEGAIEVPKAYDTVGWYKYGPTPGEIGPAVVLGHVDTYKGPAVLYSLGQVKKGDPIEILRADGSKIVFTVRDMERVRQSEFPTDKVYGNTDRSEIRIITCTGTYNKSSERYSHNLIVYGVLENVEKPEQISSSTDSVE